ncbi:MAG: agmatine deiminase family protein [Bdellovibrionales bacterium]|nr:agmatine deiminase family protein [Bdellovibrionales bacterium]
MTSIRMPAEWEQHRATWIAWPHEAEDWPGKFPCIDWVYAEICRALALSEVVEIICLNDQAVLRAKECLELHKVDLKQCNFHCLATNRSWLRDSAPTAVVKDGQVSWTQWYFNAWAKYDNFELDQQVPRYIGEASKLPLVAAQISESRPFVLEGGAIETDGAGTLIVTQECLQSEVQCRNPGLSQQDYEALFLRYLGISKTIWLEAGCEGDDTHGHIDDVARFVSRGRVLLAFEDNPSEQFHSISVRNEEILKSTTDAEGKPLEVVRLPMPEPLFYGEDRLPASYANFYIANNTVIVPTFNDPNDLKALQIIGECFPGRSIRGISAVDLVLGFGTLHCLTQQEPAL